MQEDAGRGWDLLRSCRKPACGHPGLEGSQGTQTPEPVSLPGRAEGALQTAIGMWLLWKLQGTNGAAGQGQPRRPSCPLYGDVMEMLPHSEEQH